MGGAGDGREARGGPLSHLEVPSLKPLHGVPALFFLAILNIALIAALVFLTQRRSDSFDKSQGELTRLVQHCIDTKVIRGEVSR